MIVPSSNDRSPQKGGDPSPVPPADSALLMAAATMHQMGRLGPMRPGDVSPPPLNMQKPKPRPGDKNLPPYQPIDSLGIRGELEGKTKFAGDIPNANTMSEEDQKSWDSTWGRAIPYSGKPPSSEQLQLKNPEFDEFMYVPHSDKFPGSKNDGLIYMRKKQPSLKELVS
jgi:hypothetical protein